MAHSFLTPLSQAFKALIHCSMLFVHFLPSPKPCNFLPLDFISFIFIFSLLVIHLLLIVLQFNYLVFSFESIGSWGSPLSANPHVFSLLLVLITFWIPTKTYMAATKPQTDWLISYLRKKLHFPFCQKVIHHDFFLSSSLQKKRKPLSSRKHSSNLLVFFWPTF